MGRRAKDYSNLIKVGQKFGGLTVVELPEKLWSNAMISCRCDCGNEVQVRLSDLLSGNTQSCGCLQKQLASKIGKKAVKIRMDNSIFHGDRGDRSEYRKTAYFFWHMHERINGKYKSKGITICDDWCWSESGYNNFKAWLLGELSRLNLTLGDFNKMHHQELSVDRIDNKGLYSPDNCRLATQEQQSRNRSSTRKYFGKHIYDWADEYDIPYRSMEKAYKTGNIAELLEEYTESKVA